MLVFLILISLLTSTIVTQAPNPTGVYTNKMVLVEPASYILYWNYTENDILFETHVNNNGWSAFGLSPNGGMTGSDVIVTWKKTDNSTHFTDRHILSDRSVPVDKTQNWFLLASSVVNGYLVTKFTRKIKTCDSTGEDMDITTGTPFVIFAWGDPTTSDISYHGATKRGSKAIPLISSLNLNVRIDMNQVETVDFRVNASLPNDMDTDYFCQLFKLPADWATTKRHLIRFETLFADGNKEFIHHWTVNECSNEIVGYLKNNAYPKAASCLSMNPTDEWSKMKMYCRKISLVWAIGGSVIQDFPENLAYPFGGSDLETKYFFLEIHYDNPSMKANIKDTSGFRMYLTKNYRPTEFGILTVGANPEWFSMIIPPKAQQFITDYYCKKKCMNQMFTTNVTELKVFSTMPHTHLKGKELYTTVVRDGAEVAYLANNKYYDFNYQYYNFLTNPVVLKPNDELKTKCVYNTQKTNDFTFGGHSSKEEMCMDFIWYYPKTNGLSVCLENFDQSIYVNLLLQLNGTKDISLIWEPFSINTTNYNQTFIDKFQSVFNQNRSGYCANQEGGIDVDNPFTSARSIQTTCQLDTNRNMYLSSDNLNKSNNLKTDYILLFTLLAIFSFF